MTHGAAFSGGSPSFPTRLRAKPGLRRVAEPLKLWIPEAGLERPEDDGPSPSIPRLGAGLG